MDGLIIVPRVAHNPPENKQEARSKRQMLVLRVAHNSPDNEQRANLNPQQITPNTLLSFRACQYPKDPVRGQHHEGKCQCEL